MKPKWTWFVLAWGLMAGFRGQVGAQWSSWRGPYDQGASFETDLPSTWSPAGENLIWKKSIGGRSTPIVQNGRVYLLTRGGEGEAEHEMLICLEASTGDLQWEYRFNVFHTDTPSNRVGWSSPCGDPETGNVYVHGVQGLFLGFDCDGKLLWFRSLTEEQGRISGYGGRTHTPVVDEDLVILSSLTSSWGSHGKGAHRYFACDKRTGEFVWWSSPGEEPLDTTYSTPVVSVVNGVRLLIAGCADGAVYALKARTGEKVWGFKLSKRGLNVSPVIDENRVAISQSEENLDTNVMGRIVCIDAAKTGGGDITKTGELWRIDGLLAGYCSPAIHAGRLYVVDNSATLYALDAQDGKKIWEHKLGTVGKGSPVWANGKIYVGEVNEKFHILEAGEKECKTLSTVKFSRSDGTQVELNGSPAVAGGRIYFTTRDEIYCIGKKDWKGSAGTPRPFPPEAPARPDDPPAYLLVTPAELLLKPGEAVQFRARLYNARGQYLRDAESASWTAQGLKLALDEKGKGAIAAGSGFQAGEVKAKAGSLENSARVRVVPPLPIEENFEATRPGALPPGWLGLSPLKFKIAEVDGGKVLVKHGENARFMRADAFIGPASFKNYTIQADVRGNFRRRSLPDIGLIGQRYRLMLLGNNRPRALRLVTWIGKTPRPRLEKDVPFNWREEVWYRMKLKVSIVDGKGLAQGKVWPRDQAEPSEWTIELEDPSPHREGAPGITAFSAGTTETSPGTDIAFDNLKITPN
ncbi:MAG: PQQ-binding-like beta-propeller repeat protein [Planctomycetes bacterium]|nr:PQQ-binding-like beta-propeller repeat protein [Planctomycetota bacterium]